MKVIVAFLLLFGASVSADTINTYYQQGSAPKYFHSENQLHGICVEYIEKLNGIMQANNVQISVVKGANFSRIKKDLASGKISIFFGITKTKERSLRYDYGSPLYSIRYSFAVPMDDSDEYIHTTHLVGKKVGVIAGTKSASYLENHYHGFKMVKVNSIHQALKMLDSKRIDAVFYHDLGLSHQIKSLKVNDKIKVLPSSAKAKLQYFAYSKKFPERLKTIIEKAFVKIVNDGDQIAILKRYGVYQSYAQIAGL